ncbi:MAG TPA: CoA-binding protein [Thermoanaerobaculia bacterium]
MARVPESVASFLQGTRFAVAGVSREGNLPANAIFRKLKAAGYDAVPVNPNAETVEGVACYPNLAAIPGAVDGLVIAAHPDVAAGLVKQAAARGVKHVWFHRSFGEGSVSDAALEACRAAGIAPIVGGCPLMYCAPVDVAHRCFRWWLGFKGRLPA